MRLIDDPLWGKIISVDSQKLQEILDKIEPLDVAPVVRCKDCKRYDSHDHRCKVWNHGINKEDFCSRGERKEE